MQSRIEDIIVMFDNPNRSLESDVNVHWLL